MTRARCGILRLFFAADMLYSMGAAQAVASHSIVLVQGLYTMQATCHESSGFDLSYLTIRLPLLLFGASAPAVRVLKASAVTAAAGGAMQTRRHDSLSSNVRSAEADTPRGEHAMQLHQSQVDLSL